MRRLAALLTAALAAAGLSLAGCATRERANPFDPANQGTQGRPTGFVALASDRSVTLRWGNVGTEGLAGYRLERKTANDTAYRRIATIASTVATEYVDRGLLNGLDHAYRLSYLFESGGTSPPAEDVATPGPIVPWVADGQFGRLARLTADGRHVFEDRAGFTAPGAVAADTLTGDVWMSDGSGARLWLLRPSTGVLVAIPAGGTPGDLAVDHGGRGVWVGFETGGQVRFYDSGGAPAHTIPNLGNPAGLALVPSRDTLWICERDSNRVRRYDPDIGTLGVTAVTRPSRVALDAATGEAWVTSFVERRVHRLTPGGALDLTLTSFGGPVGIAVDARRGRIWVADLGLDRVVALDRDGGVAFTVGGLDAPRAVAVDPATGEAWVACAESGEIVRIAAGGAVLRRLDAFGSATGIALSPRLGPPTGP